MELCLLLAVKTKSGTENVETAAAYQRSFSVSQYFILSLVLVFSSSVWNCSGSVIFTAVCVYLAV